MVTRIIHSLTLPVSGLHKAAYVIALLTVSSQILALIRDRLFAHTFGAGEQLDLYYAAFKIPDLLFAGVITLISAYVLIPRLTKIPQEEIKRLVSETMSFLILAYGAVALLLALFLPYVLPILYPNLYALQGSEFLFFQIVLLVQPLLLGVSNIFGSVSQSKERFTLFALSPVLYNLGIITGTLLLYPPFGFIGIAYGVLLGALMHLCIHIFVLKEIDALPSIVWPDFKRIGEIIYQSFPRSLALFFIALQQVVLTALAASSGVGLVAVFSLAQNIQAIPLSLVSVSYATAAFPLMARQWNSQLKDEFTTTFLSAAKHIIFWSVILSGLVLVLRAHIVRVLLGSGAFDWNDTRLTAAVLALLMISLVAQGIVLIVSRALYASGKSWVPSIIQGFGLILSVLLAYLLLFYSKTSLIILDFFTILFRVEDVEGNSIVLIAVSLALAYIAMAVISLLYMYKQMPTIARPLIHTLVHSAGAGIIGATASYGVLLYMGNIAPLTTLFAVFAQGLFAGMVGSTVAALVLLVLDNAEFKNLYLSLIKKTTLPAATVLETTIDGREV